MMKEAEIEEALKSLLSKEGVTGYVVINGEGIPVKHHDIDYTKAGRTQNKNSAVCVARV